MTPQELQSEWNYRYQERLALLCVYDGQMPTPEQDRMAREDADEAVAGLTVNQDAPTCAATRSNRKGNDPNHVQTPSYALNRLPDPKTKNSLPVSKQKEIQP
jgi:hypothetical protein